MLLIICVDYLFFLKNVSSISSITPFIVFHSDISSNCGVEYVPAFISYM